METVCQLSYPLNSENASPFGTRTVYLASPASCAEVGLLPKTARTERASDTTTTTTGGILLLHRRHSPRCSPWLPLGELDGAKRSACSKVFWGAATSTRLYFVGQLSERRGASLNDLVGAEQ